MSCEPEITQPAWVCNDCGTRYGRRVPFSATFHIGTCGVCGSISSVTESRDYCYLRPEWQDRKSA